VQNQTRHKCRPLLEIDYRTRGVSLVSVMAVIEGAVKSSRNKSMPWPTVARPTQKRRPELGGV
jgi:hypothetical protein